MNRLTRRVEWQTCEICGELRPYGEECPKCDRPHETPSFYGMSINVQGADLSPLRRPISEADVKRAESE